MESLRDARQDILDAVFEKLRLPTSLTWVKDPTGSIDVLMFRGQADGWPVMYVKRLGRLNRLAWVAETPALDDPRVLPSTWAALDGCLDDLAHELRTRSVANSPDDASRFLSKALTLVAVVADSEEAAREYLNRFEDFLLLAARVARAPKRRSVWTTGSA